MVLKVLANSGQVLHDLDVVFGQFVGCANARKHEDLWRVDHAC